MNLYFKHESVDFFTNGFVIQGNSIHRRFQQKIQKRTSFLFEIKIHYNADHITQKLIQTFVIGMEIIFDRVIFQSPFFDYLINREIK